MFSVSSTHFLGITTNRARVYYYRGGISISTDGSPYSWQETSSNKEAQKMEMCYE
jgi:hypothetical protein